MCSQDVRCGTWAVIRHFVIDDTCYAFRRGLIIEVQYADAAAAKQCGSHTSSSVVQWVGYLAMSHQPIADGPPKHGASTTILNGEFLIALRCWVLIAACGT